MYSQKPLLNHLSMLSPPMPLFDICLGLYFPNQPLDTMCCFIIYTLWGKGCIHKFDGLYYGNEVLTCFWLTIVEVGLVPWQAIKKNLRLKNLTMVYDKHVYQSMAS